MFSCGRLSPLAGGVPGGVDGGSMGGRMSSGKAGILCGARVVAGRRRPVFPVENHRIILSKREPEHYLGWGSVSDSRETKATTDGEAQITHPEQTTGRSALADSLVQ